MKPPMQGRCRLSESDTAMERRRRFLSFECMSWGEYERGMPSIIRWGGGGGGGGGVEESPQEKNWIQDVCRSNSYAFWGSFFLLETKL